MSNSLAAETSPYLLQHAGNPVAWYPWGQDALETARREDKPILLSIGYAACHWCHVMAHESFEDEDTARLMNDWFVNIKVDREERPDLDQIYQLAHQVLTRRPGGWPLTVFLSPGNQMPFFAGTYFPNSPRHGMATFKDVLQRVHDWYRENEGNLAQHNQALADFFQQVSAVRPANAHTLGGEPLSQALDGFKADYDHRHGGFGAAPKFPQAPVLAFLMYNPNNGDARRMLTGTLDAAAAGGLNDHVGGGFFRYCVDADWTIPHFEKMLYDNAQLLGLYAAGAALFNRGDYRRAAIAASDWLIRAMQDPSGGFYSSLDADSEGEEGKFYVWGADEIKSLLSEPEWHVFAPAYGLDRPANFEGRAWHLRRYETDAGLAGQTRLSREEIQRRMQSARDKLLQARAARTRPGLDDKQLTAWNALTIGALAKAGRLLREASYIENANGALRSLQQLAWRDGRLLASVKDGEARNPAYLDDYAYLLDACIELLQARWHSATLHFAVALADALLEHFEDAKDGGFYFTAHDHEALIQRPRPFEDREIPSGNGAAAVALQRLGHLLAEPRYLDAAQRTLQAAWQSMQQAPQAHPGLLCALDDYLHPPPLVILRGSAEALVPWQRDIDAEYRPARLVFAIPADAGGLPENLRAYQAQDQVTAWVCTGTQCSAPITGRRALKSALAGGP